MDEKQYRATFDKFNERPCLFSKAILRRCGGCSRMQRVLIAERESVYCYSPPSHARCGTLLELLHHAASLKMDLPTSADEEIPHGKEIKIQCGGLMGIAEQMQSPMADLADINRLNELVEKEYGSLDALPFQEIAVAMEQFQSRRKNKGMH